MFGFKSNSYVFGLKKKKKKLFVWFKGLKLKMEIIFFFFYKKIENINGKTCELWM